MDNMDVESVATAPRGDAHGMRSRALAVFVLILAIVALVLALFVYNGLVLASGTTPEVGSSAWVVVDHRVIENAASDHCAVMTTFCLRQSGDNTR